MAKEKKSEIHITNNFNAPIGQHIDHVDTINFRMDGEGGIHFGEASNEAVKKAFFPDLPTKEEMQKAVMTTYKQGYWWSGRSWAVVYRVWQMKGYMKSISDFVRDVTTWPQVGYACTYDAVQKPIAKGLMIGTVDKWESNGANTQNIKLANALFAEIDKIREIEADK